MTEDKNTPFEPDWISHPYESVQDCLDEHGISHEQFGHHMGWDAAQCDNFFSGIVVIDQSIADRLASITGGPASFWLARQALYTSELHRLAGKYNWQPLDGTEIKDPQMLEIFMYEDRKGHHCIVTKMAGETMRSKIQYNFRHPLHSKPTIDILAKALDLMAGFVEEMHKDDE